MKCGKRNYSYIIGFFMANKLLFRKLVWVRVVNLRIQKRDVHSYFQNLQWKPQIKPNHLNLSALVAANHLSAVLHL